MLKDDIRRAIEAAPRAKLDELGAAVWKAWGAGAIGDDDAQALAELAAARKVVPVAQVVALPRRGSRPRTPESLERRRRWVASGWLPPRVAACFTAGEVAVLSVIAAEIAQHAQCDLSVEAIAAKAGVGRSTVRSALHEAKQAGLLVVIARPDRPFHHRTNLVRMISPEWRSWLSMRRSSQGSKSSEPTKLHSFSVGDRRQDPKPSRASWGKDSAQKALWRPPGRPYTAKQKMEVGK